jgi:hypothetical protein
MLPHLNNPCKSTTKLQELNFTVTILPVRQQRPGFDSPLIQWYLDRCEFIVVDESTLIGPINFLNSRRPLFSDLCDAYLEIACKEL